MLHFRVDQKAQHLPPKYFYDAVGSVLFERITRLPEYYPTRSELELLHKHAPEILTVPPGCVLIEFGGGSSTKRRVFCCAARQASEPICRSEYGDFLAQEAAGFAATSRISRFIRVAAGLDLMSSCLAEPTARRVLSRSGNFEPHEAARFLCHAARIRSRRGLYRRRRSRQAVHILYRAYNDAEGVTAKFNLNLLARINRELGGNFDLEAFEHLAFYNRERSRIEMHLASTKRQYVRLGNTWIEFRAGENHSHREQLQVFDRHVSCRRTAAAGRHSDPRPIQRACLARRWRPLKKAHRGDPSFSEAARPALN